MRKQSEINQAIKILRDEGSRISLEQANVLSHRWNERFVFEQYVKNVSESDRNEELFFAARDAARFLKGDISLEVLAPWMDEVEFPGHEEEMITVSAKQFNGIIKRLERLERRMKLSKPKSDTKRKSIKDAPDNDLISQAEACKYVGCGKTTIKRWANNGFITGYLKGLNVYYSKHELDRSAVVKEHRSKKEEKDYGKTTL
ncbi:helix-turn-helix domain-containing protein [Bacteroides sp.]|uniref:helix-turn-helix domain-containing protein n=1 Tax=Bacteroides sp. TaxID=29523 RepID=UPI002630D811|nr:helix-turn-helix domain-containing protein [Bacteroides sp.]MDD3040921.1 helix-turn-helix domain-containing protein [Bacteroides sp.]